MYTRGSRFISNLRIAGRCNWKFSDLFPLDFFILTNCPKFKFLTFLKSTKRLNKKKNIFLLEMGRDENL